LPRGFICRNDPINNTDPLGLADVVGIDDEGNPVIVPRGDSVTGERPDGSLILESDVNRGAAADKAYAARRALVDKEYWTDFGFGLVMEAGDTVVGLQDLMVQSSPVGRVVGNPVGDFWLRKSDEWKKARFGDRDWDEKAGYYEARALLFAGSLLIGGGEASVASEATKVERGVQALRVVGEDVAAATKSTSKGVQLVEDIIGPNAKATLNEAGDLVIESQNGLTKVRFDINRTVPHKNPHAHVEVFEQIKNKKVSVQKSGPIYPKDVPHE